jgi:predicted permease
MRRRFEAIPGVRAATMSDLPLVAEANNRNSFTLPGVPVVPDRPRSTSMLLIGPSFFETMGIPILLGRPIGPQDTAGSTRCAVVNEVFAKEFFPGVSPVGRRFVLDGRPAPTEIQIVGVAKNSLYSSLKRDIPPVAYLPSSQPPHGWFIGGMHYEVRTAGDPLALANTVRRLVHETDPRLPVADLTTQKRRIDLTIAPERAFADLCTCFGVLALLIACVGLYGTMAYSVARRTNEIGIRLALGAERRRVIRMVLREVFALSMVGVTIGLAVALETARLLASFLYGVRPTDPFSFGISVAVLLTCALAAGYAPAWRASRIDPMHALRHE